MCAKAKIGIKVQPPEKGGRRLVITDIHGCAKTFIRLLEKVELTKQDQLFLLGDFINRGPRSKKTLNRVLALIEDGYQVFPLRGNHEETLLHIVEEKPGQLKSLLRSRNSMNLLNKHQLLRKRFYRFIKSLPYYYELEDCYLVHAGFNLNIKKPFTDTHAMAWVRNFSLEKKLNKKRVYFGHTPTRLSRINEALSSNAKSVCLDNGCSHLYLGKEYGRLVCLDLDSKHLYTQKNID